MSDGALGLGIVGCGGAAADVCHAVARVPGLRVVGLHDNDRALADDLARFTGGQAYESLDELLGSDAVQAVYVALPHDLLAPVALRVLDAGRHALVEKPLALSLDAVDQLEATAAQRGRTLGVFYEMRFAPVAMAAARMVHGGAIGQVRAVRIRTLIDKPPGYWHTGLSGRSQNPWRGQAAHAGGGVVLMNTSHQLDMVAAITGLAVTSIAGTIATTVPGIDVEDTAAAVMSFANGAIGSIVAGAHVPGAQDDEVIEIDGELGQVTLDAYAGMFRVWLRRPFQRLRVGEWLEPSVGPGDPFAAALAAFVTAASTGARPPVGAPEARAVLATVLGLYRSAATGLPVVLDAGTGSERAVTAG